MLLPDSFCFGGAGSFGAGAALSTGASALSASSPSFFRAASLRAIVALRAAALAFAAWTRTAFLFSLLMPASKATKEMPPWARGFDAGALGREAEELVALLLALPLPLPPLSSRAAFGFCGTMRPR